MNHLDKVSKNSTGVLIYKNDVISRLKEDSSILWLFVIALFVFILLFAVGTLEKLDVFIMLAMTIYISYRVCMEYSDKRDIILSFNRTGIMYFKKNNFILIPMNSILCIRAVDSDNKYKFIVSIHKNEIIAQGKNDKSCMLVGLPSDEKTIIMDEFRISLSEFSMIRDYMVDVMNNVSDN